MSDPIGCGYAVSHRCMSDPIGCGYAVSHFVDPFLLWLCGQSLRTIGSDTTDRLYIFSYTWLWHGH